MESKKPKLQQQQQQDGEVCLFDKIHEAAQFLKGKLDGTTPLIGVICGSGLGPLADKVEDATVVGYEDIPHFPVSTTPGHAGKFVLGKLGGVDVVVMKGRTHLYEGLPLATVTIPTRTMCLLGIKYLFVTNAAGGLNEAYEVGDLMILRDHINLPGLCGSNPLIGPYDPRLGARFVPTSQSYDRELQELGCKIAHDVGLGRSMHSGVYCVVCGPTYESIAEARMQKLLGADATGMSTVPEVFVALQHGVKCFAVSLITNKVVTEYESLHTANHEEVIEAARSREKITQTFFIEMCKATAAKDKGGEGDKGEKEKVHCDE
eukprot:m.16573 g.16573  ORF g.16573 m.16573 type:complete len:319 (-) comp8024_c0_seq1:198-1154(-)